MQKTGIKRRIDDLGRIVIPRDIRDQFKIKAGDNFDIYIDEDKIVLQKFSPINKQQIQLYSMCEVLSETIDAPILFYYDSEFLDPREKIAKDSKTTTAFENILSEFHPTSFNDVQLFLESNETMAGYTYPIIKDSNIIGVFIIFKQLAKLDEKMIVAVKLCEQLLLKMI